MNMANCFLRAPSLGDSGSSSRSYGNSWEAERSLAIRYSKIRSSPKSFWKVLLHFWPPDLCWHLRTVFWRKIAVVSIAYCHTDRCFHSPVHDLKLYRFRRISGNCLDDHCTDPALSFCKTDAEIFPARQSIQRTSDWSDSGGIYLHDIEYLLKSKK